MIVDEIREAVKNYLADFVRYGGRGDNHFSKKTLAKRGGHSPPPPLNGKFAKLFREFFSEKG